jgi:O-antigen/teichoic acid export membrane protein
MSALALVILWVAARPLVEFLHLGYAAPVIALACYTWSSLLVPLPRGALMGLNRVHLASAVHVIEPLVRLLAGVALVWWGWGVTGAVTGYSIGNLLGFALALLPLRRLLARAPAPAAAPRGILRLDRYAMLVLLINTALMLIASVDQIAVQHFFSGAVAGNYAVAFLLGRIIVMTTMALGWVLFTRSAIIAPDHPRRARVLLKSLGVIAALALTITAGFQIAPTLAVRLLGGAKYHLADDYLALVAIEMTLFALVYIQAYYHISIRKTQVVIPLGVAAGLEIVLLAAFHSSVEQMLGNLILLMAGLLVCVSVLSWGILRTPARLGQANVPDAGTPVADVG